MRSLTGQMEEGMAARWRTDQSQIASLTTTTTVLSSDLRCQDTLQRACHHRPRLHTEEREVTRVVHLPILVQVHVPTFTKVVVHLLAELTSKSLTDLAIMPAARDLSSLTG